MMAYNDAIRVKLRSLRSFLLPLMHRTNILSSPLSYDIITIQIRIEYYHQFSLFFFFFSSIHRIFSLQFDLFMSNDISIDSRIIVLSSKSRGSFQREQVERKQN